MADTMGSQKLMSRPHGRPLCANEGAAHSILKLKKRPSLTLNILFIKSHYERIYLPSALKHDGVTRPRGISCRRLARRSLRLHLRFARLQARLLLLAVPRVSITQPDPFVARYQQAWPACAGATAIKAIPQSEAAVSVIAVKILKVIALLPNVKDKNPS